MKFELAATACRSLVIPNGIDSRLLKRRRSETARRNEQALAGRPTLVKVGRFDPDKNGCRPSMR